MTFFLLGDGATFLLPSATRFERPNSSGFWENWCCTNNNLIFDIVRVTGSLYSILNVATISAETFYNHFLFCFYTCKICWKTKRKKFISFTMKKKAQYKKMWYIIATVLLCVWSLATHITWPSEEDLAELCQPPLCGSFKHSVGSEVFDKVESRKLMW